MNLSPRAPHPARRNAIHYSNPSSPRSKLHLLQLVRNRPTALRSPTHSLRPIPQANSLQASPKRSEDLLHLNSTYSQRSFHLQTTLQSGSLTDRTRLSRLTSFPSSPALSPSSSPPDFTAVLPASTAQVLSLLCDTLLEEEKRELAALSKVYYMGTKSTRLQGLPIDDSKGNYPLNPGDHLNYRYEILSLLGKGSFGHVVRCIDHKKREHVAVKVLRSRDRLRTQGLIEVKALTLLRDKDPEDRMGLLRLKTAFEFRLHLCIVTDILGVSLYDTIRGSGNRGFPMPTIRRLLKQITTALAFTHNLHIIHCDLKPENVLFRLHVPMLRLIDFGSCCFDDARIYTYIQSRFYRAPEIILGAQYSQAIDIWSLGCLAAELCMGKPLFQGEDERRQIGLIVDLLGLPPLRLVDQGSRSHLYFKHTVTGLKLLSPSKGTSRLAKPWKGALGTDDPGCLDFIKRCLAWQAEDRLTAAQASVHSWVQG